MNYVHTPTSEMFEAFGFGGYYYGGYNTAIHVVNNTYSPVDYYVDRGNTPVPYPVHLITDDTPSIVKGISNLHEASHLLTGVRKEYLDSIICNLLKFQEGLCDEEIIPTPDNL